MKNPHFCSQRSAALAAASVVITSLALSLGSAMAMAQGKGGGVVPPPPPNRVIAFASGGIKTMNDDGTNVATVYALRTGEYAWAPTWSHDGLQICFFGRIGTDAGPGFYRVPSTGGTPTRICGYVNKANPTIYDAVFADWSPQPIGGRYWILFPDLGEGGRTDLWAASVDGEVRVNLTMSPMESETEGTWSPDVAKVAFANFSYLATDGAFQILDTDVFDLDGAPALGTIRTAFASDTVAPMYPRWSHQSGSQKIVVAENGIGWLDLSATSPSLTNISTTGTSPSYSPLDDRVAYNKTGTKGGIFTMNADGSSVRKIFSGSAPLFPCWKRQ